MDEKYKRNADKTIENTINIFDKKIYNIVEKFIYSICTMIIISIIIFWGFIRYHTLFLWKPQNVEVKTINKHKEYLDSISCVLTLENQFCDNNPNEGIVSLDYKLKLPKWVIKNTYYSSLIDDNVNKQITFNMEMKEASFNKYRLDKNYSKKTIIINSLIYFIFVKDLESINFEFADNAYLIEKIYINTLLESKYVKLNELLVNDNWTNYVINNLNNSDFIDDFLNINNSK